MLVDLHSVHKWSTRKVVSGVTNASLLPFNCVRASRQVAWVLPRWQLRKEAVASTLFYLFLYVTRH